MTKTVKNILIIFLLGMFIPKMSISQTPIQKYSKYVDKFTGDFHYSIPLMTVSGKHGENVPLVLTYNAGIRVNQEAGDIGLGWNLPTGEIVRQVNGVPDDWHEVPVVEKDFNYLTYNHDFDEETGGFRFTDVTSEAEENSYTGAVYFKDFDPSSCDDAKQDLTNTPSRQGSVESPNYDFFYVSGPGIGGEFRGYLFDYASLYGQPDKPAPGAEYCTPTYPGGICDYKAFSKSLQFRFRDEVQQIEHNATITSSGISVLETPSDEFSGGVSYELQDDEKTVVLMIKQSSSYAYLGLSNQIELFPGGTPDAVYTGKTLTIRGTDNESAYQRFKEVYRRYTSENPTDLWFDDHIHFSNNDGDMTYKVPDWEAQSNFNSVTTPSDVGSAGFSATGIGSFSSTAPSGRYIEYFSNKDIVDNPGSIEETPDLVTVRGAMEEKDIGAFKITMPNGLCYHYSLPVYQLYKRNVTHKSKYQAAFQWNFYEPYYSYTYLEQPYVSSWKLTAVTGKNYEDSNSSGFVDPGDAGYWVAYRYTKLTSDFCSRSPYSVPDETAMYHHNINYDSFKPGKIVTGFTDTRNWEENKKEKWTLEYIQTSEQTAVFIKSPKEDGHSLPYDDTQNTVSGSGDKLPELKIDRIALINTTDFGNMVSSSSNNTLDETKYSGILSSLFNPDFLQESNFNDDTIEALKGVNFTTDYTLSPCIYNSITNSGKLSLKKIEFEKNGVEFHNNYAFEYNNNQNYHHEYQDYFGFYKSDYVSGTAPGSKGKYSNGANVDAWSLSKIYEPTGASLQIDYESDRFEKFVNYSKGKIYQGNYAGNIHNPEENIYNGIHWEEQTESVNGGGTRVSRLTLNNTLPSGVNKSYYLEYEYQEGSALNNPYDMYSLDLVNERIDPNPYKGVIFNSSNKVGYGIVSEFVKDYISNANDHTHTLGLKKYYFKTGPFFSNPETGYIDAESSTSYIIQTSASAINSKFVTYAHADIETGTFGLPQKIETHKVQNDEFILTHSKDFFYELQKNTKEYFHKFAENLSDLTSTIKSSTINKIEERTYALKKTEERFEGHLINTTTIDIRDKYTGIPFHVTTKKPKYTTNRNTTFAYRGEVPGWGPKWLDSSNTNELTKVFTSVDKMNGSIMSGGKTDFTKLNKVLNRSVYPFTIETSDNELNRVGTHTYVNTGKGYHLTNTARLLNEKHRVIEWSGVNDIYTAKKYDVDNKYVIAEGSNTNYFAFGHSSFEQFSLKSGNILYNGDACIVSGDISKCSQIDNSTISGVKAHTGNHFLKINSSETIQLYKIKGLNAEGITPGKRYKVSTWVHKTSGITKLKVVLNGSAIHETYASSETEISYGDWRLKYVYIDIPVETDDSNFYMTISVENSSSGKSSYIDDIDFRAVDAETGFSIYDQRTGLLSYSIDKFNHYTKMVYDQANRLIETYIEYHGEEKLIEKKEYNNKLD